MRMALRLALAALLLLGCATPRPWHRYDGKMDAALQAEDHEHCQQRTASSATTKGVQVMGLVAMTVVDVVVAVVTLGATAGMIVGTAADTPLERPETYEQCMARKGYVQAAGR
jgi:hypothetical protein